MKSYGNNISSWHLVEPNNAADFYEAMMFNILFIHWKVFQVFASKYDGNISLARETENISNFELHQLFIEQ